MKSTGEPHAACGLDSIVLDLPIIVDDHNIQLQELNIQFCLKISLDAIPYEHELTVNRDLDLFYYKR